MPEPLMDLSEGRLKSWPGGGMYLPRGVYIPFYRHCEDGETPIAIVLKDRSRWIYPWSAVTSPRRR